MQTITKHYIDGTFVESQGSEVMDIIKPTNSQVIARVTLADEEDTRHAIAAAKGFDRADIVRDVRLGLTGTWECFCSPLLVGLGHHSVNRPRLFGRHSFLPYGFPCFCCCFTASSTAFLNSATAGTSGDFNASFLA
jgi:hypothetical protein